MEEREQIRTGITALLENFWIQKKDKPDDYMVIKKHKKTIQKYFIDNFGYQLFSGIDLFKLEKVPYQSETWMGIQDFKEPMDYSIFVAILAFLEDKAKDDLFLINTLSEYVKNLFNNELEVKWEIHKHRLSFYRAMKHAQTMDLVEVLEGEIEKYKSDEKEEILYRPTMISKYYMRFFSKPIHEFQNMDEILADRWKIPGVDPTPRMNLQSLHRRLFFSPVVYKNELTEEERRYLNYQSYRLAENIPEYTYFELEIYRNELLLISKERNITGEQHPNQKTISDIVLQFSAFLKEKLKELPEEEFPDFEYIVGRREFVEWFEELQEELSHGWSKEFKNTHSADVTSKVLEYLEEWKFAHNDFQTHSVVLYPPLVRIGGEFPREYKFERYFLKKIWDLNLFDDGDCSLPTTIFEEMIKEFNAINTNTPLRLKNAHDVIDKYVLKKDEQFIELNEEKIIQTIKGV
ncbi:TIGR02678 family protein [Bacillus litorisediminis]|uniref:TIGR02678 family protein n=1 Tax=Bacillus litorisediminis TaxID=2922713 RepID=UPI001FAD5568|nr:TIGR02678 family protein [Bacillus litorisediminis]